MRVLVCGGRDYADRAAVFGALDAVRQRTSPGALQVIQGGAGGADALARAWCRIMRVPCVTEPAEWERHRKAAGPIRNQKMIDTYAPELVLAFPGGRGTADMVSRAENAGISVERAP